MCGPREASQRWASWPSWWLCRRVRSRGAGRLIAGHCETVDAAETAAAETEGAELAKKLSNPLSDLFSVPFQFNWETGSARGIRRGTSSTSSRDAFR